MLLICGIIKTYTNLYVSKQALFDLLLGYLWQRKNYISIDEYVDRTYLLFKDSKLQETKYEILVTSEGNPLIVYYTNTTKIYIYIILTSKRQQEIVNRLLKRVRFADSTKSIFESGTDNKSSTTKKVCLNCCICTRLCILSLEMDRIKRIL